MIDHSLTGQALGGFKGILSPINPACPFSTNFINSKQTWNLTNDPRAHPIAGSFTDHFTVTLANGQTHTCNNWRVCTPYSMGALVIPGGDESPGYFLENVADDFSLYIQLGFYAGNFYFQVSDGGGTTTIRTDEEDGFSGAYYVSCCYSPPDPPSGNKSAYMNIYVNSWSFDTIIIQDSPVDLFLSTPEFSELSMESGFDVDYLAGFSDSCNCGTAPSNLIWAKGRSGTFGQKDKVIRQQNLLRRMLAYIPSLAINYRTTRACNCPAFAPPPAPPMDFMGNEGGDEDVELTWTPNPQAICYNIYRGETSGGETLLVSCTTTPYFDEGITCGTTYYYYITAVTGVGEGPPSPEIVVITAAIPDPPADFAADQLDELNTELTWTAEPGVAYYKIYRGDTPGSETILADPVFGTTFTDGAFTCGNTYYYYITSVGCAESDPSAEITVPTCCIFTECCECMPASLDLEVNELYGCPVTGSLSWGGTHYGSGESNCQGFIAINVYCFEGSWFADVHQTGEGGPGPTNTYPMSGSCEPFSLTTGSQPFDGGGYGASTIEINLTEP